jgi:hypothetical protein
MGTTALLSPPYFSWHPLPHLPWLIARMDVTSARLLRPTTTCLVKIREAMRIKVTRGTQNVSKVE